MESMIIFRILARARLSKNAGRCADVMRKTGHVMPGDREHICESWDKGGGHDFVLRAFDDIATDQIANNLGAMQKIFYSPCPP